MNSNALQEYLVCFIHIPKTAGSSFTDVLIKLIGQDKFRILLPDVINGIKEPDFDLDNYNGVSGHFPYEISKLFSKPALFLTFLRDPLSRSLSHFKQIQRTNLNYPWIQKSSNFKFFEQVRSMSFIDFIEHPFFIKEVANLQTRMLGLLINRSIQNFVEVTPIDQAEDRWFDVALAKERLEHFAFVGLQERFQDSLDIFSYRFGSYPIMNPPIVNISSDQSGLSSLPELAVEKLMEANKLDIELYEFAQRLFTKRHDEMTLMLRGERQAKTANLHELLSAEYCQKRKITDLPYRYEFEEMYQRAGWHQVERVNERMWTWSGPETTSSVNLPLNRAGNLRIKFQITHFIEVGILESLELRIDDQRIHLIHAVENGIHLFSGIIPAHENKQMPTAISFRVNRTAYPPGMTAESPGARLLGFALSWIEISPLNK